MHCTAVPCPALLCTALLCTALPCAALCYAVLRCALLCCAALCAAVLCCAVRCAALCYAQELLRTIARRNGGMRYMAQVQPASQLADTHDERESCSQLPVLNDSSQR